MTYKLAEQSQPCFLFLLSPHITQALLCNCRETDLQYDAPCRTWQKKRADGEKEEGCFREMIRLEKEDSKKRKEAAVYEVQRTD